jgi:hypothetical protein
MCVVEVCLCVIGQEGTPTDLGPAFVLTQTDFAVGRQCNYAIVADLKGQREEEKLVRETKI